jgi:hypothetical protein
MEELNPRVEVTHVRVGHVDERLDLRIDRPDHITRQQIVDDDSPVLEERAYKMLRRCISLNPLELSVMT